MLEFLAKLYFFFVRTFDGEKLHSVRPKRKSVYLLIKHLKLSVILYYLEEFIDVLYINSNVFDGSIFHLSLMVLISLDDEIVELEKGYFLGAVYCAPVVKSLIFIMNLCLDNYYDKTFFIF